jgi:hypothetical protein
MEASFFLGLIIWGCILFAVIGEYIKERKGGKAIFVFLVCLVYSVYLVTLTYEKKNKVNFLDEKDGSDERNEIDLLTGRRGRTGTRLNRTHSFKLDNHNGKKMLSTKM